MLKKMNEFNTSLAAKITSGVATMWCAYAFAIIALISLPDAIKSGNLITIVGWVAQTFLQLVLLSIIMVGQNVASLPWSRRLRRRIQHHSESLS